MTHVTVAPGFILDDEMYERTAAKLRHIAPEWAPRLTWDTFTTRENWRLVPDVGHPELPFFKAELVLLNEPPWTRTIKINVWVAPDLRRDGQPLPHNHPWESFRAHVVMGGYEEVRYKRNANGGVAGEYRLHPPGNINTLPHATFHEVTSILSPGRTVSVMDCGPGKKDDWGYLDPDTGLYTPNKQSVLDPRFRALLLDRNPHLR